jgi:hypothetical protein
VPLTAKLEIKASLLYYSDDLLLFLAKVTPEMSGFLVMISYYEVEEVFAGSDGICGK